MTFLNSALLAAGLACIALPILIHILMRRRRRPVQWAAMRFLLEAYRQQRTRMRFEQWLLLAARCLLVALIALAVGKPVLQAAGVLPGRGPMTAYIVIDNTLTAQASPDGVAASAALERHKERARRLLDQLDSAAGDRAALVALAAPADELIVPPTPDISSVRTAIEQLTAADSAADFDTALSIVSAEFERSEGSRAAAERSSVVVLSDFLTGSADVDRPIARPGAALAGVNVLATEPAGSGVDNAAIVDVKPLRPITVLAGADRGLAAGPVEQFTVALRRSGPWLNTAGTTRVLFRAPDRPGTLGQTDVRWQPGQSEASASAAVTLPLEPSSAGASTAIIEAVIDRDAIGGDNTFRRVLQTRLGLRVALVAPVRSPGLPTPTPAEFTAADWLGLALRPMTAASGSVGGIELTQIEPASLDAPRLAALDAVVLTRPDLLSAESWSRLSTFTRAGGLVLISAPAEVTVHTWTDQMQRAFELDWTIARESAPVAAAALVPAPAASAEGSLLALVAAELGELVKPVSVSRLLPVTGAPESAVLFRAGSEGQPVVIAQSPGAGSSAEARGLVVFFAAAPELSWTDLPAKPLMVPLVQELIRQGVGRSRESATDVAGRVAALPPRTVELSEVQGSARRIAVDAAGRAAEPIRGASIWRAVDERGSVRATLTINADTRASASDARAVSELAPWLAAPLGIAPDAIRWLPPESAVPGGAPSTSGPLAAPERTGPSFGLWLLLAAAVLAVIELVMARYFSHAWAQSAAAPAGASSAGARERRAA